MDLRIVLNNSDLHLNYYTLLSGPTGGIKQHPEDLLAGVRWSRSEGRLVSGRRADDRRTAV